eukprot:600218-Prymnesium_polylepis.1
MSATSNAPKAVVPARMHAVDASRAPPDNTLGSSPRVLEARTRVRTVTGGFSQKAREAALAAEQLGWETHVEGAARRRSVFDTR